MLKVWQCYKEEAVKDKVRAMGYWDVSVVWLYRGHLVPETALPFSCFLASMR